MRERKEKARPSATTKSAPDMIGQGRWWLSGPGWGPENHHPGVRRELKEGDSSNAQVAYSHSLPELLLNGRRNRATQCLPRALAVLLGQELGSVCPPHEVR